MRVIAGNYRSRLLQSPSGLGTRPTSDRLRETLFNVLAPRIAGANFVDLYAGSGAVGIEAISRGAAFVWFAENERAALASLRGNLSALKIASGYALEDRSVVKLLAALIKAKRPLDIIFLDPPYEAAEEYISTMQVLSRESATLLAPAALVIAEHRKQTPLPVSVGTLHRSRLLQQGDAALSFYTVASSATEASD